MHKYVVQVRLFSMNNTPYVEDTFVRNDDIEPYIHDYVRENGYPSPGDECYLEIFEECEDEQGIFLDLVTGAWLSGESYEKDCILNERRRSYVV